MKRRFYIPLIVISTLFMFQFAFPQDESLKPRVALVPMFNTEEDDQIDFINEAIDDVVMLNLERIRMFVVSKTEVMDPYKEFTKVKNYAKEARTDNIIFGKTFRDKKENIIIQMSVYDKVKNRIVITRRAEVETIFEIFDAANELIVALVKEFAGMHIGFGIIELASTGEEGDFEVYIDGDFIGENIYRIKDVLNGIRYVEVRQDRMLGKEVIFGSDNWVYEDLITKIEFSIPYLIKKEAAVLTGLEGTIVHSRKKRGKEDKVFYNFKKIIGLLKDVSYCKRLEEERERYRQMEVEYELQVNRWKIEDSFLRPDKKIFDELVSIHNSADSYINPATIREKAIENANLFYNILGVHAAYDFSQSEWKRGIARYKQIERMSYELPASDYYQFEEEYEYVKYAWERYLAKNERNEFLAEMGIGFRFRRYLKNKVEDSQKIFKNYSKLKEKELIIFTNPSGLRVYINDKYYGNSPLRVKKLSDKMLNVHVKDPWAMQEKRFVNLKEKRNFLFIKSSLAREITVYPPVLIGQKHYRFSWEQLQDAESYIMQVDEKDGNFISPIFETYGVEENTYNMEKRLKEGRNYVYGVQGINVNEIKSDWSYSEVFTGRIKWSFATGGLVVSSPAVGKDGTVYVGSDDRCLYALDSEGNPEWIFPTGGRIKFSPAVGPDGTIYFGSDDWSLYALNPDGTPKWIFPAGDKLRSSPVVGPENSIYFSSDDGFLYALNPDGSLKWNFTPGGKIGSSPAVGPDGIVYFGTVNGNLYALNPDGSPEWIFSAGSSIRPSPAVGQDGTVYFGSDDRCLYALNPDGTPKWIFPTGAKIRTTPVIGPEGTIYIGGNDRNLYALNHEGIPEWVFTAENSIRYTPAVDSGGNIYVSTRYNRFYALNKDGEIDWSYLFEDDIISSLKVGPDGTIFLGSDDRKLYTIFSELL